GGLQRASPLHLHRRYRARPGPREQPQPERRPMARGDRAITPRARRRRTFPAADTCISGEWVFAPDRSIGATISRRLAGQRQRSERLVMRGQDNIFVVAGMLAEGA